MRAGGGMSFARSMAQLCCGQTIHTVHKRTARFALAVRFAKPCLMNSITIPRPDDWHLHLRDGAMLEGVIADSARHFARAIIMPNLVPPVVTGDQAAAYRDRILAALPEGMAFEPLMTLYLTETTDPDDVAAAVNSGLVKALKLYPAGATTNSDSGVRDFDKVVPVLERMAELGTPLCVHGEVTDSDIDIFDREAVFIDRVLDPLRRKVPGLRVVMEHITTSDGVAYARSGGPDLGATITTHHLIINRNHILVGGIKPHYYCLPVAKREEHRLALVDAATSGEPTFFLGTDSAPHPTDLKENACGCAGCYTSPNTMSLLAHVFEAENALDQLAIFASQNGPAFYRLPVNDDVLRLTKRDAPVAFPATRETGAGPVTLFDPGFDLFWEVETT
ncbi:dihydroorotase, homodimeric type [Ahrensia sp. R2A130]|nr:dihydroorotase, homodimeric type [Ahrensia sp. R2A130]